MTMTPDIPLLRKAVEWVEEQSALPVPTREWEQHAFVLPAPGDPRYDQADLEVRAAYTWQRANVYRAPECGTCYCVAGYVDHLAGRDSDYPLISESARLLLGITDEQASELFRGSNDALKIRRVAERIAGETL